MVEGSITQQVLQSEAAVTAFSGNSAGIPLTVDNASLSEVSDGNIQVSLLTEGKIKKHLIAPNDSRVVKEVSAYFKKNR